MWESEKTAVLETARELVRKGLVVGTSGNISVRIKDGNGGNLAAITPSGCFYDSINPDDIVIVNFEGLSIEGSLEPTVEKMLHIGIYRARDDVNAIVHSHSVYGSILSVSRHDIPLITEDQAVCLRGEVKVAGYAQYGSIELAQNVVQALADRNAVIMANHGTLSVGTDIRKALTNCEILENTAKIYVHALLIGKVNGLPADREDGVK